MIKKLANNMNPRSAGKPDVEMGKLIQLRRVEQGISQTDLGDTLGVSFQQVQKYEKGINRVGAARLRQISTALRTRDFHFVLEFQRIGSPGLCTHVAARGIDRR